MNINGPVILEKETAAGIVRPTYPPAWGCKENSDCPKFFVHENYPLKWGCLMRTMVGGYCRLYYPQTEEQKAARGKDTFLLGGSSVN